MYRFRDKRLRKIAFEHAFTSNRRSMLRILVFHSNAFAVLGALSTDYTAEYAIARVVGLR